MNAPREHAEPARPESDLDGVVHRKRAEEPNNERGPLKHSGSTVSSEHSNDSRRQNKPATAVFVDAEAMKAKLRMSLTKPEYDVADFYHKDGWCQLVARSSVFEKVTLAVIAFNALWIAIDTDMNGAAVILSAHPVFQIAEHGFCVYFFWEWIMRFFSFKRKRDGLRDAWFVFDSVLVFMMVAETWVMSIVLIAVGGASGGLGGNTGTLRLLRLLRLSRMARMAKLLRSFPELLILIKGIASALRSVFVTLLLLFLLIYVYSIIFRQLTDGSEVGNRYFPDMWVAIHTLWLDGTLLDSPGSLVVMLLDESIIYVFLFYSFVLLGALTVMNMLIGVLCEVVSAVASTEREQIIISTVKDGFMEIITQGGIDTDGDNLISRQEFVAILENPDAVKLLMKVDVDPYAFVDLADFLFEEEDGQELRQMTFAEFMETVLSLRGTQTATVKDVVDLRKFIKTQFNSMDNKNEVRQSVVRRSIKEAESRWVSSCPDGVYSVTAAEWETNARPAQVESEAPPAVGVQHSGLTHSCPSPSSVPGPPRMWTQVAEMQGVLLAAQRRLEQFVQTIPSPPHDEEVPVNVKWQDAFKKKSTGNTAPAGFHRTGSGGSNSLVSLRHERPGGNATATTAAVGAGPGACAVGMSSAALGSMEEQASALPGAVRDTSACPEVAEYTSESSVVEVVEGSHHLGSSLKVSASPNKEPLPSRLAEVRARLQRLGKSLELGVEELRAIQDML